MSQIRCKNKTHSRKIRILCKTVGLLESILKYPQVILSNPEESRTPAWTERLYCHTRDGREHPDAASASNGQVITLCFSNELYVVLKKENVFIKFDYLRALKKPSKHEKFILKLYSAFNFLNY